MSAPDPAYLAAIVDSSEDAIIGKTLDGVVLSWNPGAEKLYGYAAGEAIGRFIGFLAPAHRSDEIPDILARIRRGERIDHYETERVRKDGRIVRVSLSVSPVRDDAERIIGAAGIARDITEARALQDELRRQKETLDLVGLATNDLIWDRDFRTGRTTRSHAIEGYGYAMEEVGQDNAWWTARLHPEDSPEVEASLARTLGSTDATWSAHYRFRRKDGTYASVVDRGFLVRDTAGVPLRIVGSMYDATEIERAQALAKRSAASAELLSRASHELRTPLNAILGFSDLLEQRLDASLGPRERRYLQNIRTSGQHLLSLVDRLLQISRADSGTLELRPMVMTLRALVEPVVGDLAASAAAAGISLTTAPLPDASIRVDLGRMATVLHELVANAIAATPPGGSVVLSATIPDDGLVIEVADTGRGIHAGAQDRVFGVFERIHDDAGGIGTGLGLALCRELVELHGGTISFHSEPGRGTTFRVQLPHVAWGRDGDERVLIIEDEPNDADLAMTIVTDAGFRCEVVGTVVDARAAILHSTPKAVVLDLHLPDGDGNEILALLGTLGRHVPVAIVTAFEDKLEPVPGGVRFVKPVDPAELRAWLESVTRLEVPV